ncbi:rCG62418 [Rattus norvegicus]|uniref:RCG62418 n=1 Tax=Rattus norvegicus TaxID=10116 RepID=A6HC61_RAT|nr:rCG62418 [Rattus norvegicus]
MFYGCQMLSYGDYFHSFYSSVLVNTYF